MYEIDEAWLPYFEELDPKRRLSLFNERADGPAPFQDYCRTLYHERYTDPKHPDRKVDTWLWKLVYLPGLYRRRKFLRSAARKELEGTLKELHLEHPEALSEMEKAVLYLEFRNAPRRYLSTCRSSRYANRLMGLKKATEEEKRKRACEDIWMIARGLPQAAGMEESFQLWSDALRAELSDYDPNSWKLYEELERNYQKK